MAWHVWEPLRQSWGGALERCWEPVHEQPALSSEPRSPGRSGRGSNCIQQRLPRGRPRVCPESRVFQACLLPPAQGSDTPGPTVCAVPLGGDGWCAGVRTGRAATEGLAGAEEASGKARRGCQWPSLTHALPRPHNSLVQTAREHLRASTSPVGQVGAGAGHGAARDSGRDGTSASEGQDQ